MPKVLSYDGKVVLLAKAGDRSVRRRFSAALSHMKLPRLQMTYSPGALAAMNLSRLPLLIIASEGLLEGLSSEDVDSVGRAVEEGLGLVSFDASPGPPPAVRELFGVSRTKGVARAQAFIVPDSTHYITRARAPGETTVLPEEVRCLDCLVTSDVLSVNPAGNPLLCASERGRGRTVQWLCSPEVWDRGHGEGLDDLFYRSILWAARKPLCALSFPPFVAARFDDASGGESRFRWMDAFNRAGFVASAGVFLDEIDEAAARNMRGKFLSGWAEFSAHAFSWENPIYMTHDDERPIEFDEETLAENFCRHDSRFDSWGIEPASLLNAHWKEVGRRAAPYLASRGITAVWGPFLLGEAYHGVHGNWEWGPFGASPLVCSETPAAEGILSVDSGSVIPGRKWMQDLPEGGFRLAPEMANEADFLWNRTVAPRFAGKPQPRNMVDEAAEVASRQVARGLDSMFFGAMVTREPAVCALSEDELHRLVTLIESRLARYDYMPVAASRIAEYCASWQKARFVSASVRTEMGRIVCRFEGESERRLLLSVYLDEGGEVFRKFVPVEPFRGRARVVIAP